MRDLRPPFSWWLAIPAVIAFGPVAALAGSAGDDGRAIPTVEGATTLHQVPSEDLLEPPAGLEPLDQEALDLVVEHGLKARERRAQLKHLRKTRPLAKSGALAGKRIVLSPGHGIHAHVTNQTGWGWQRNIINEIIEDKHTYEWVHDFVQPMLERAGAETMMLRANGYNETFTEVKLDKATLSGNWSASGDYRQASADSSGASAAKWQFKVASTGDYPVYVRFKSGSDRVPDASYTVTHAAGKTSFTLDQGEAKLQSGGSLGSTMTSSAAKTYYDVWHYVGTYPFREGETYAVELSSKSSSSGKVVVAGHVFVGEGPGSVKSHQGSASTLSGYYKWQESSSYFLQWMGMPDWLNNSDYYCRPYYALFEGADAYLSLHTNYVSRTTDRGTQTYVYYPNDANGNQQWPVESQWSAGYAEKNLPTGTYQYATAINNGFVDYVRTNYDGTWPDRHYLYGTSVGELYVTRNAWYNNRNSSSVLAIPTALIETAFHGENKTDAAAIKDQAFRFQGARGILAGFIHYFKGEGAMLPPLPPTKLSVSADGCTASVSWVPVQDKVNGNSKPSRYNVYTSPDGILFGRTPAATVTDTKASLPIARGETLYVKVTAVNDAGESLDSMVGAARLASPGAKRVLYVDGTDRDRKLAYDANNLRSFARIYGPAVTLNDPDLGLATVDDEAIPDIPGVGTYGAVVWAAGDTSVVTDVLPKAQRDFIASLRSSGTPLLISGAEIGYALSDSDYNGDAGFLGDRFSATYVADDSGDHTVKGFPGISETLTYGPQTTYGGSAKALSPDAGYVHYPDALGAKGGGTVLMTYASKGTGAAILSADKRSILVGFPLESIVDPGKRRCAIANLLSTVMGTSVNSSCAQAAYRQVAETCGNGQDDDCNGKADCDDGACAADVSCQPVVATEVCDNGKDDDGDGAVDCQDPDCLGHAHCADAGAPETDAGNDSDAGTVPTADAGAVDGGGLDDAGAPPDDPLPGETDAGTSQDPSDDGLGDGTITIETGCSAAAAPSLAEAGALLGLFAAALRRRRRA